MFQIRFKTDNAAFDDGDHGRGEIVRILRDTARRIEAGEYVPVIRDANGNTVGRVTWEGR